MEVESSTLDKLSSNGIKIISSYLKTFIMKKIKLSLIVALAIAGAAISAFTAKSTVTPGWYGQTTDAVPPYDLSNPIPASQLNSKCPASIEHICAVQLDMNGNLVATRRSKNNFK